MGLVTDWPVWHRLMPACTSGGICFLGCRCCLGHRDRGLFCVCGRTDWPVFGGDLGIGAGSRARLMRGAAGHGLKAFRRSGFSGDDCAWLWLRRAWRAHAVAARCWDWRYYGPIEGRIVGIDRSASDAVRLTLDRVVLDRCRAWRDADAGAHLAAWRRQGVRPMPGMRVMMTGHLSPPRGRWNRAALISSAMAWFARLGAVGYTRGAVAGHCARGIRSGADDLSHPHGRVLAGSRGIAG